MKALILKSEKERLRFNKDEYRSLFLSRYELTGKDMDIFWNAFMDYGMSDTSRECSHSTAAHYYFQSIVEHYTLDWKGYGRKMPNDAIEWMKSNYSRLVGVTDVAPSTI